MKRSTFTLAVAGGATAAALLRPSITLGQATTGLYAGKWHIDEAGDTFAHGDIELHQQGGTVVGSYGERGAVSGVMGTPNRLDATWTDARGTGWMTTFFDSDGKTLYGEWGYQGKPVAGRFVGHKIGPDT